MKIQSLKLVYFSPTGTTKAVLQGISKSIICDNIEHIDITKPKARKKTLYTTEDELLIVGVPVYMGRVPAVLSEWLHSIKGRNTPTVCVVVYGNRVYDNALLELKNILTDQECTPFAGAAYIGEHSFHSSELPAASEGRPDKSDLNHSELFGQKIHEKLLSFPSIVDVPKLNIPGYYPYGGVTKMWDVDFIEVSDECTQCGVCNDCCPTGAIDSENSALVDTVKCTLCCACIKHCSKNARSMKSGLMKDAAIRVHELFRERKEPEFFI